MSAKGALSPVGDVQEVGVLVWVRGVVAGPVGGCVETMCISTCQGQVPGLQLPGSTSTWQYKYLE